MPHSIYKTDGIVLASRNFGEANKFLELFTRDLGLVRAAASGIRFEKSKLRPHLVDFSRAEIALVCGKNGWRVTGVSQQENYFNLFRSESSKAALIARVFALLRRLIAGEEKNEVLYQTVVDGLAFLGRGNLDEKALSVFEPFFVLRILGQLGYVGDVPNLAPFMGIGWETNTINDFAPIRREAILAINRSLQESNL